MSTRTISRLSDENLWVAFREDHPITGSIDLSGTTVELSLAQEDPATYITGVLEGSTTKIGPETFYVASFPIVAGTYTPGRFTAWLRITRDDGTQTILDVGSVTFV